MGIRYEAPGVISAASLFNRGRGGGGGGGSGGGGFSNVVQLHDDTGRQENQLDAIGLQGTIESSHNYQQGQIRGALQAQAAELDVWQFQQKVTEQEQAQLRQDQNSIAAIDADNTMSAVEKMQAKTRIKTRIDWTSERQKRDLQAAQVQMAQQHAQAYKMQSELDNGRLEFMNQSVGNKLKTIVDDDAAQEIGQDIETLFPGLKERSPLMFAAKVTQEAIRQKRATRYTTDKDGVVDLKNGYRVGQEPGAAGTGSGARSSTGTTTSPTGEQVPTVRTEEGMHKTWLETKKVVTDRLDRLNKEAKERGEDEPFKGGEGGSFQQAIINEMTAAGFDPNWATHVAKLRGDDKKAAAVKLHEDSLAGIDALKAKIEMSPATPPNIKQEGMQAVAQLGAMIKRFPPSERGAHPEAKKQIDALYAKVKQFQAVMEAYDKQAAGQKPSAAPAAQPGPQGHWTDRSISQRLTSAKDAANKGFDLPAFAEEQLGNVQMAPRFKSGLQRLSNFFQ